ncbi:MAG: asparagine synthase (glutamine-hydrolyzing) [Verrucomicrobiaceae bacterium]|nr:asparagine synthase (glutamine-hydrolyzing) [Verrucomicrobiaceae bacterium]
MCGIAGYWGAKPRSREQIDRTLDLMRNRGPDHRDSCSFDLGAAHADLLHTRLSIIDLDPRSHQPFTIGDTTVIFNGEIYNYVELRQELEKRGIALRTASDTEALLHYYRLFGEKCVEHFEGMWAFAICDAAKGTLFLSRDRFGEKPLYFVRTADGFAFGSEVKFLRALSGEHLRVNRRHVLRNLVHGYKSLYKTSETWFVGVEELRAGHSMTLNTNGEARTARWWQPQCRIDGSMSLDDAISGSRHHLLESVRLRLRSDVPLAFCLSGGVDSAALVSIAAKQFNCRLETFSIIDTDERYNEEDNIMATVRDTGCAHNLLRIPQENVIERLTRLITYHDAPIATITYYVHSLISQAVHDKGYRVAFSGTSADELFTGYYDHFLLHLNEVRNDPGYARYEADWRTHIDAFVRNPILKNPHLYRDNPGFRDHVFDGADEIREYLARDFSEPFTEERFTTSLLRNRMMNELFHEATPVILHEDDLNSMLYSVENRSPYLDSRLFDFAFSIPSRHLIHDGYGKYILRQAMQGILNDQVRLDRKKKGFNASINSMVNFSDPAVRDYLLDPKAAVFDLIKRDAIARLFDLSPVPNHLSKFLFNFINARIFLEQN